MRQAMTIMKQTAAQMAVKAQEAAERAAADRAAADRQLAEARDALADERTRVSTLQVWCSITEFLGANELLTESHLFFLPLIVTVIDLHVSLSRINTISILADGALQAELENTSRDLSRASQQVETLRVQLSTAVGESKQLKADLAKLTEEAAVVERKLAAEVLAPALLFAKEKCSPGFDE